MKTALLLVAVLLAPTALAQLPVPLPVPVDAPSAGPAPDEGDGGYVLGFDCASALAGDPCPARDGIRGEALTSPALALDATSPTRIAMASLSGAAHDVVTVQLSTDAGRTFARVTLPEKGVTDVALAAADGTLLIASSTGAGIVVRRVAFEKALEAGAPEATLPASAPTRLSATWANGTAVVSWAEGERTHVAWAAAGAPWATTSETCATPSNLVTRAGIALLVCAAPLGLPEQDLPAGHLALYALNLTAGNLTLRSHAAVVGDPHLVVNETGALTIAAFQMESARKLHLRVSTSDNGTGWFLPLDAGARLHRADAPPVSQAGVVAMTYQPNSQTIHLVWSETPATVNATERRVVKSLVALTSRGVMLYKHDLDVDEPAARVAGNAVLAPVADAHDALLVVGDRELLAFGDDGALVHGELTEKTNLGQGRKSVGQPPPPSSLGLANELTARPKADFTLGFEIAAGLLVIGVVVRVLVGRIVARAAAAPEPQKEGP